MDLYNLCQQIKKKNVRAPGKAEVDRAKKDGRWAAAYDSPKNMKVPAWFEAMIKKNKIAYENYQTLNKAERYSIAYDLQTAVKDETKQRRAQKYFDQLVNKALNTK